MERLSDLLVFDQKLLADGAEIPLHLVVGVAQLLQHRGDEEETPHVRHMARWHTMGWVAKGSGP